MAGAQSGVLELPYQATAAAAIAKLRFVTISADQTVRAITLSSERPIGVAKNDVTAAEATSGKGVTVQVLGVAWVEAGGTVTRGGRVMPDTSGKAIDATTATNIPCGVALKGTTVSGEWVPVLLTPGMPAL